MASPMVMPGRKRSTLARFVDVQRISKPQLSLLILVGTSFVVALVLLVWLLLWISRTHVGIDGWWISQRGLTAPVVGYQADDLRRIVKSTGKGPAAMGDRSVEQALKARLAGAGRRPVIVYLSAVGVADDQGGYLLRSEPGSLQAFAPVSARQGLVTPERLIDLFAQSSLPRKLLILDAGQVASDRNLGVFANGFVQRLRTYLEAKPVRGLVVLCSCAPGQSSWVSETDQSSVFGHFVALGLSGAASGWDPDARGMTARGLGLYVRHHVSRWVAANRQAEQTPILLGDTSVKFALRQIPPSRPSVASRDPKETERLFSLLDAAWARRDTLQGHKPYRHTPVQWRRHLETLLHAERLVRAGEHGEADELLASLPTLEKTIVEATGGLPFRQHWSLALLGRDLETHPSESRRAEWKAASEKIDEALRDLTVEGDAAAQSVETEATAGPAETPAPAASKPQPGAKAEGAAAAASASGSVSTSAVSTKRKRPVPKGEDRKHAGQGISALVHRSDKNRPNYVEAQLLVWAETFTKRSAAPYGFKGLRGELFDEAVGVRRVAEEVAASDERIGRWIVPLVEAGDELRRKAQDELFAGGTGRLEGVRKLLEEARTRDRQALHVAERLVSAFDLLEQVESELPFYGEWKARQPGRHDEGLDDELLALFASSTRLAKVLQGEQPEPGSRRTVAEKEDETPESVLDRIKDWEPAYREVKDHWERLLSEFHERSSSLAAAGGADRWREIDRLLAVPLIKADIRKALVHRVHSAALASSLTGSDEVGPIASGSPLLSSSSSAPTDFDSYARQKAEKAVATARSRDRDDIPDRTSSNEGPSAPDPDFWNQALALARLDWGLLELGGAPEPDLVRLESAFNTARSAARSDPEPAFEAFERLSRLIRSFRAERFHAVHQGHETTYLPLAAGDRAVRVLPLAETLGASDTITATLDRYHRQALLLWHGRRLTRDFAPEHAMLLFEEARTYLDTEPLREARDEAAAMSVARIGVTPGSDQDLVVKEWSEQPMEILVTTTGPVPPGHSVVLVNYDPSQPVVVNDQATRHGAREGVLVPVGPDRTKAVHPVDYLVGRTESTIEPLKVTLGPGVFYRGRYFPSDRGVDVNVEPAHDPVAVTIRQSYEGLAFKDFTDQFKEHPGQGFLHYATKLKYKLVFTSDLPMKLVVRYGLKEHPESFKTKTIEVSPKRQGEVIDFVMGNDFQIVKTSELLEIPPLTLQVTAFKDKENGEVMGRGRYPFRMIPPQQYISVAANFDPGARLLYLDVVHLANDPVTGPIKVYASIGGREGWAILHRSRFASFVIAIPLNLKKVRWRVGVESMPNAFYEEIDTPAPQVEAPPEKPPAL